MRQGLGYKYQHQARRLADFVSFMEARKATTITTKLAMAWATLPPDRHASWALRLTDVRGFARHLANIDPLTETPPAGILPRPEARKALYLQRCRDRRVVGGRAGSAASRRTAPMDLPSSVRVDRGDGHASVRGDNLQRDDVDLEEGVLTVRQTKFGKSRLVPLHPTTCAALHSYAERRDAHLGSRCGPHFFVAERGGRLLHQYVHRVFWRLSCEIGLRRPGDHSGPRVHDLRHRFADSNAPRLVSRGDGCRTAASCSVHLSRPHLRARHLLVSLGLPGLDASCGATPRSAMGGQAMKPSTNIATLIERYFTERLIRQRNVSANTIASYRDTFRLLFMFAMSGFTSRRRPWRSMIWTRSSSARFSRISRRTGAPASGRVICG